MPLGTDLGLGPDDIMLDGIQLLSPERGHSPPIFGPFLLWRNGWMHQNATWYGGRPQPRRLCVRWGPSSLPTKAVEPAPQFSAHVYCGQTAGCINMPLVMEVGLSPGDLVLDGDPAPYAKRGAAPPNFRPTSIVAKWLHGSRCHLVRR